MRREQLAYSECVQGGKHRPLIVPLLLQVNLATGEGLDECLEALTAGGKRLVAVINCAALSQACCGACNVGKLLAELRRCMLTAGGNRCT